MKRVAALFRRVIVPSSWGGLILRLLVVVVLVAVIVGSIDWNASVDHARKRASEAIAQVPAAMDEARLAASENTWEGDQLAKAQAALIEANASYDSGSFFNRGSYERARTDAEHSLALSVSVLKRVSDSFAAAEALAQSAQSGGYKRPIDAFFAFYKRYPRTMEAQDALDEAESTLFTTELNSENNYSAIDQLAAIAYFETHYPLADVPSKTAAKARDALLEIARAQYSGLKSVTAEVRSWVHAMLYKGRTAAIDMSAQDWDVSTALKLVPALRQPPAMLRLLSLLKGSVACWKRMQTTYEHPSSTTSTTTSYSSHQISSIDSLINKIAANLSQEKTLLAKL